MKYHVIPREQLFPEHLSDGILKNTLLGNEYQVMIHLNSEHKVFKANISFKLHCGVRLSVKSTEYTFLFFRHSLMMSNWMGTSPK